MNQLMAILAIFVTLLFGTSSASAQIVIEDQIGDNYEHLFPHTGTRAFWEGGDSYSLPATRRIAPTGGTLGTLSVTGVFITFDGTRNLTTEEIATFEFATLFYEESSQFLDDPMTYTWTQHFDTPSNSNWLTPIGEWNGWTRYRFDFDLSSMNETINPGQDFAIAFAGGSRTGVNGRWRTCFSDGQGLGQEIDLAGSDNGSTRIQDYLNNLNAPSNWHATEITVVPEPATLLALGGGVAFLIRKMRRKR